MMTAHYQDDKVTIHKIKCGPYDNNSYLIVCEQTNESIIIDTPPEPALLIEVAKTTSVKAILITHGHIDHIQSLGEVASTTGAKVGIGAADSHSLSVTPDFLLCHGDDVRAGTFALKVISTPGHTPGSTCLSMGKHLFTGDTLFPGGPGKTDSPENLRQIIWSVTDNLFVFDNDLTFYPGHGDDGDLKTAKEEYQIFASKDHPEDLSGDVLWLED